MKKSVKTIGLKQAGARSARIRRLYHQLEERNHGARWSKAEDVVGFLNDFGQLGRLVMEAEGRWVREGNSPGRLEGKLAECLWWLFVLADRTGVDLNHAFLAKLAELEAGLSRSVAKKTMRKTVRKS